MIISIDFFKMERYAFVAHQNPVFQRFRIRGVQIGIYQWITVFFSILIVLTQYFHLCYNETRIEENVHFYGRFSTHHLTLIVGLLALIVIPLAIHGTLSVRGIYCVPYLFYHFISLTLTILLIVFEFTNYVKYDCGSDFYHGVYFISILPFHLFGVVVSFVFIVFAQQYQFYVKYDKEITNADCLFQLQRQQLKAITPVSQLLSTSNMVSPLPQQSIQ
ncbi:hypothetical protein M3Y95_01193300 [Aphelenchoides besseyi]|nr:hypothetical protein M3Y95_01193300 [Aphelenchoides besseyi]